MAVMAGRPAIVRIPATVARMIILQFIVHLRLDHRSAGLTGAQGLFSESIDVSCTGRFKRWIRVSYVVRDASARRRFGSNRHVSHEAWGAGQAAAPPPSRVEVRMAHLWCVRNPAAWALFPASSMDSSAGRRHRRPAPPASDPAQEATA